MDIGNKYFEFHVQALLVFSIDTTIRAGKSYLVLWYDCRAFGRNNGVMLFCAIVISTSGFIQFIPGSLRPQLALKRNFYILPHIDRINT